MNALFRWKPSSIRRNDEQMIEEGDDGTLDSRLRAPPWRVARGREEGHRHRADHALPDGTIDPDAADAQWAQNTLQPRRAAAQEKASTTKARPRPRTPKQHRSAMSPTPAQRRCRRAVPRCLQARTVNEVVKAQTNKVRAGAQGELVDRAQAMAHVFKLARIERDAWLNWPARISGRWPPSSASTRTRCTSRWKPPCAST
jgi:hypothetical protein